VLVVAGGLKTPVGALSSSFDVLESGLLETHGIRRVGVAGHPEGSPDISASQTADALARKNELAGSLPFEFRIVTQFALAGDAYVDWERGVRTAGNRLPVIAGIPGVTSPPRLLKFALACGIGPSIEVLRKQSGGLLKLATSRSWKPDEVVSTIAESVARDPASLITGLHVFPFGGLEASAEWLAERRAARASLSR
jgi:methylenetetrahydrofolate reductase (NADPH)